MASDDILTRPLGRAVPRAERLRDLLRFRLTRSTILGGLAAALVVGGSVVALVGDPLGGEPHATALINVREAEPDTSSKSVTAPSEKPASGSSSATEVEGSSGVTVVRPLGTAAPTDAVIIRVPNEAGVTLAAAPDPRLTERGRHGSLPKLGEGRVRALDVYARPAGVTGGPRIALVVSGLGIGQAATAAAVAKLPAAVSLAYSPYGADLDRGAARAREAGHEILLHVPMEPFDYPDSDPGPQTLLTTLRPAENLDKLAWAMSRFSGFVGIVNFMGAKLTADAAAFEPVMREIANRGLGFLDDGSSPRTLSQGIAAKMKTPWARAEIVVDVVPRAEAIDRELARLEAQARTKGLVIASASALPLTVERISRWSRDLEARGVRLVPVSAALRNSAPGTRLTSATP
ncbi:MAG: divergent polysaccharide deacetylase family protein [Methylobacterium sp.]|uniref:divergent polysaccharide deacetylase family protein n=1 Tax=Methylobacterium sp. TaxID=409 RepID=UPI0025D8DE6C|nr:divergent polysaccharide deacetylase family protein [Methylobacterium sp.]MBX9930073.1 divergent polysaccharide deacetylase family protein [Methylobacterium sp.]